MLELKGLNGESLALDAPWLRKLRAGQTVTEIALDRFQSATLDSTSTKKFILFGKKEEVLILTVQAGTFLGLQLPVEKKAETEKWLEEVKKAAGK